MSNRPPQTTFVAYPSPEPGTIRILLAVLAVFLLPLLLAAASFRGAEHWSAASWESAGIAPDPATHPEAMVQVYAARTWGWKGSVAVHSWIVLKPENAPAWQRYDVVGWGVASGRPAVRRDIRAPDGYWAGNRPELVAELRGEAAAAAIPRLLQAIRDYPYPQTYRTWPGPNSNSFIAFLARQVPELRAEMPPTAIGKDWLPGPSPLALAPSGTGIQLSLFGVAGVLVALEEGIEVNLLGFVVGVDPLDLAIKLPGFGRISCCRGSRPLAVPQQLD